MSRWPTVSGALAELLPAVVESLRRTNADCLVVIPTYNEQENIGRLIPAILAHPRVQILVVDDNSPDGTGALVALHARASERVTLLARAGKLGFGSACIDGFRHALAGDAQFLFQMDADFSHDPRYLSELLAAAGQSYDLVLGSRYVAGGGTVDWGLARQLLSRGGNLYARLLLDLPINDATGGFRCYRRSTLETIDLASIRSNGYAFQIEMLYRALRQGAHIGEVPILFPDRRVGKSKMSHKIVVEAVTTVWRLRMGMPRFSRATAQRRISDIARG
jgi:dolichol-phosphate mannosyltransferase